MSTEAPLHLCGWVDSPARHALAATFAPPLAQAAPNLMGADQDVLLYRAFKEVLGDYPHYVAQQIGDCFLEHTPVTMADGSRMPISNVKIGSLVLSHTGAHRKVSRVVRKPYSGNLALIDVIGQDGQSYSATATPDHLFWTSITNPDTGDLDWGWKPIGQMEAGDVVSREGGSRFASVNKTDVGYWSGDVFCLEVEGDHSFQANGFDVHNCTSFGSGHALDLLQCIEAFLLKEPIAYLETCTEAIYGMGREIAGMLGGGDGCYGVAVAKALVEHGAVPRKLVGDYSGRRAKDWGSRGVPAEIKTAMAEHKLGSAALVTTLEELDAALANLYPAAGGFGQGFTMHRDKDGVCQQSGRWGHEQCCAGRRTRNGRRQYLLLQSWGDDVPDGPLTDDQPSFSFWIDETPMADILGQRDFLAFSKFPGFEKRPVPAGWTIKDYL